MGGGHIDLGQDDLRTSPIVAVGSLDDVCGRLVETREKYGISYFTAPIEARPDVMAPVIEQLRGAERSSSNRKEAAATERGGNDE